VDTMDKLNELTEQIDAHETLVEQESSGTRECPACGSEVPRTPSSELMGEVAQTAMQLRHLLTTTSNANAVMAINAQRDRVRDLLGLSA
jgi:hypothetical protein